MPHDLTENPLSGMLELLTAADDAHLRQIAVPDTLVVGSNGEIRQLYVYDPETGLVAASKGETWTAQDVADYFVHGVAAVCDVVAVFVAAAPQVSVDYMTADDLAAFMTKKRPPGLLQRYIAASSRHQMTQVIWTPFLTVIEKRLCIKPLTDPHATVTERTATAKAAGMSREVPVSQAVLADIERLCRRFSAMLLRKLNLCLTRLNVYMLRVRPPVLLFCTALSAHAASPSSVRKGGRSPRSRLGIERPLGRGSPQREVEAARSEVTTPAPSLAGSEDAEDDAFRLEILPFAVQPPPASGATEVIHAELLGYATGAEAKRPDAYLIVPPNVVRQPAADGGAPTQSAHQQLEALKRGLRAACSAPARQAPPSEGTEPEPSDHRRDPPAQRPRGKSHSECVALHAAHKPQAEPAASGEIRKKYLPSAHASVLRGETLPVKVPAADVHLIPKPARKHIIKDKTVVGAAMPAAFATCPIRGPASAVLAVLQDIRGGAGTPETLYSQSPGDPSLEDMRTAARRLQARKRKEAAWKTAMAVPFLNSAPLGAPAAGRLPAAKGAHSTGSTTADTVPVPAPHGAPQQSAEPRPSAYNVREANWDPSTVLASSTLYTASNQVKHQSTTSWLNTIDRDSAQYTSYTQPARRPTSTRGELPKPAHDSLQRRSTSPPYAGEPSSEPSPFSNRDQPSPTESSRRYHRPWTTGSKSLRGRQRGSTGAASDDLLSAEPGAAPSDYFAKRLRVLPRRPLSGIGECHQSISEFMRLKANQKRGKEWARPRDDDADQSGLDDDKKGQSDGDELSCADKGQQSRKGVLMMTQGKLVVDPTWLRDADGRLPKPKLTAADELFLREQDDEEEALRAEAAAQQRRDAVESQRIDEERRVLENRAHRLDEMRTKCLKMQNIRDAARVRAQYASLEAKHHNEAAVDFAEDCLYGAYSQSLSGRPVRKIAAFRFPLPASLQPSHEHVHSLLTGLGFYCTAANTNEPSSPASPSARHNALDPLDSFEDTVAQPTVLPPADLALYCVSNDKVLISNIMGDLADFKNRVNHIFNMRDTAVAARLKELIDPPHPNQPVSLFHAVRVLFDEFQLTLPATPQGDPASDNDSVRSQVKFPQRVAVPV
ncbi:hypothetical protein DIPPA_12518 [Diplonema papillatum]|nr:hypothetical protein DIPPA_12518 [Diplonema papillatum]